ncbi:MAG: GNAT family N-acetyltransferase [Alphaproteobacteria bacterium]|nr:GNAT family N-acetyltransferase [Alphaproteobacteria bacterium]
MPYRLEVPASQNDWQAFHDIRETELFLARHSDTAYDRNHVDDFVSCNHPLLFKRAGRAIGVVRLDKLGAGKGAVRLVAITAAEQGKGHGRVMADMCEGIARALGMHTLFVNAAPEAIGFYEKTGLERFDWDPSELVSIASQCVQMRKRL